MANAAASCWDVAVLGAVGHEFDHQMWESAQLLSALQKIVAPKQHWPSSFCRTNHLILLKWASERQSAQGIRTGWWTGIPT